MIDRAVDASDAPGKDVPATWLAGEVMAYANTADLAFGMARTIALPRKPLPLESDGPAAPGHPGGTHSARTPTVWMRAEDAIEIEGIGGVPDPAMH